MSAQIDCIANEGRDQLFSTGEHKALPSGDVLDEAIEASFRRRRIAVQLQNVGARLRVGRLIGENHGIALPSMEGKLPTGDRKVVLKRSGNGLD